MTDAHEQEAGGPRFFGHDDRRLFGYLHLPAPERRREPGVVLSHPLGHEYVSSHRALRQLAARLTAAGHAVLRFDYFGCGDSDGELAHGSLGGWRADLTQAARELQRATGARRVALVGLGLGATTALLPDPEAPPLDALVLWDAVLDGAAYLREITDAHRDVSHRLAARFERAATDTGLEVLGFELSRALVAEIAALDLGRDQVAARAPRILVLDSSRPGPPEFLARLAELGAVVQHEQQEAFGGLDDDPFKPRVPAAAIRVVTDWIASGTP